MGSVGRRWVARELSLTCPGVTRGVYVGHPWVAHGVPVGCPWGARGSPVGMVSRAMPMENHQKDVGSLMNIHGHRTGQNAGGLHYLSFDESPTPGPGRGGCSTRHVYYFLSLTKLQRCY